MTRCAAGATHSENDLVPECYHQAESSQITQSSPSIRARVDAGYAAIFDTRSPRGTCWAEVGSWEKISHLSASHALPVLSMQQREVGDSFPTSRHPRAPARTGLGPARSSGQSPVVHTPAWSQSGNQVARPRLAKGHERSQVLWVHPPPCGLSRSPDIDCAEFSPRDQLPCPPLGDVEERRCLLHCKKRVVVGGLSLGGGLRVIHMLDR